MSLLLEILERGSLHDWLVQKLAFGILVACGDHDPQVLFHLGVEILNLPELGVEVNSLLRGLLPLLGLKLGQ